MADKKLIVVKENCPQNNKCPSVEVCPVGALSQEGFNAPAVDYDLCIACGNCTERCPRKALVFTEL